LGFAFLIPEILEKLIGESILLGSKNMWPLNYYFFNEWHLKNMFEGEFRNVHVVFGIAMIFIISYSNLFLWKALVLFLGLWLWRFGRNGW
jgi:hypothetical protein